MYTIVELQWQHNIFAQFLLQWSPSLVVSGLSIASGQCKQASCLWIKLALPEGLGRLMDKEGTNIDKHQYRRNINIEGAPI